jgi:hypothetical protein
MSASSPLFRTLAPLLLGATALFAAACTSKPVIRAQSAPGANVSTFRTYGFFEKLGTDQSTYASVLSLNLKAATAREMEARGFRAAPNPDLLVNFHVAEKDKIEGRSGPTFGFGFGRGYWRSGYSFGVGMNDTDVRSVTEGTVTIDGVDRARNEMVWTGSAQSRITAKTLDHPEEAINSTVPLIFQKFPGRAAP